MRVVAYFSLMNTIGKCFKIEALHFLSDVMHYYGMAERGDFYVDDYATTRPFGNSQSIEM